MAVNNTYALQFDGVDDHANLGPLPTEAGKRYIISGVFKCDQFQEDNSGTILSAGNGGAPNGIMITTSRYAESTPFFTVVNSIIIHSAYINGNFVTLPYTEFTTGDVVRFMVDVTVASYDGSDYLLGANTNLSNFFSGSIDELCIWDYELIKKYRTDVVKQLTGVEPGLMRYYRCDNDNTNNAILQDYTGNGDGAINGASYVTGLVDLEEPDPVIVNNDATNITSNSATLNGEILNLVNYPSLDVAFQYSPYPDFSQDINQTPIQTISSPQVVTENISGLDPSKGYYTRIVAQESS